MAQASHAGAAFQRVQIALQGLERCAVATVVAPVVDTLIDGGEEFFGLLQEDLEHLGFGLLQLALDARSQGLGVRGRGGRGRLGLGMQLQGKRCQSLEQRG